MIDPAESRAVRQSRNLNRMTFHELVVCYLSHYTIIVNLTLAILFLVMFAFYPATVLQSLVCVTFAWGAFHTTWYLTHRFVMHSNWMFKYSLLASFWKRIHFDHHAEPNRFEWLFGRLRHTLPSLVIGTLPIGFLIGGIGGAALTFSTGLLISSFNSFLHCIQHLPFNPRSKHIKRLKRRHLLHHYHNEKGNFGNGSGLWDRILGTLYETADARDSSTTVANLGYTEEVAQRYPYVKELARPDR